MNRFIEFLEKFCLEYGIFILFGLFIIAWAIINHYKDKDDLERMKIQAQIQVQINASSQSQVPEKK